MTAWDIFRYLAYVLLALADSWLWLLIGLGLGALVLRLFLRRRFSVSKPRRLTALFLKTSLVIVAFFLVSASIYQFWYTHRPLPSSERRVLFEGIIYQRDVRKVPRPLVIHRVTVRLDSYGLQFLVTPGEPNAEYPLRARTTSEFVDVFDLQLAVNGDGFLPWWTRGLFDYYPHSGDPVNVGGFAASEGVIYSDDERNHTLYLTVDNRATINQRPAEIANAVSGLGMIVENGVVVAEEAPYADDLHPRTAVGLDRAGAHLFIVVVDGRQPGYSEGVTLPELGIIGLEYGIHTLLNLDGGGSTALVAEGDDGTSLVLNSPIDNHIPGRERPVGNHLGIYIRQDVRN